ncbi:hypothetical protein F5884DRAFT_824910 [Xylogone sp. PMI_703]|nr:hypothetical protein F5884DRAFT_824910 [Xylogone sp. PMI_703]
MNQKSILIIRYSNKIFASVKKFSKMQSLNNKDNIYLLKFNVTSKSNIKATVSFIENKTNSRLNCLYNNTDVFLMILLLNTNIQKTKRIFKAKGIIVNTSSISDYLNVLFGSEYQFLYNTSKSVIITFTKILQLKMDLFNVKVLNIITGVVANNLGSENTDFRLLPNSRYVDTVKQIRDQAVKEGFSKMSTEEYTEKYIFSVKKKRNNIIWIRNNTFDVK